MVNRIIFWAGFGLATRAWQLGIQMQNPLHQRHLRSWAYPVFAACGASFGYWLQTVDEKQVKILEERKQIIMEKRARRAARESEAVDVATAS